MPESIVVTNTQPSPGSTPDWESLKESLGADSVEDAQRRAFEIAKFVADVENDKDSELILKSGNKNVALKLNK
jgi:hypothetical protein